jgi:hypothetical protein
MRIPEAHRGRKFHCPECRAKIRASADGLSATLVEAAPPASPAPPPAPPSPPQVAPSPANAAGGPSPPPPAQPAPSGTGEAGPAAPSARAFLGLVPEIFRLYARSVVPLILGALAMNLCVMIVGMVVGICIPIIGQLAALVVAAIMLLGYTKMALNLVDGRPAELSSLFAYKQEWLGASVTLLVAGIALTIVHGLLLVAFALGGGTIEHLILDAEVLPGASRIVLFPLLVVPLVLVSVFSGISCAFWPHFVVDQGGKPLDALMDSLKLAWRNRLGLMMLVVLLSVGVLVVYGSIIGLAVLGVGALGLGALFLGWLALVVANTLFMPVPLLLVAVTFRRMIGPSKTPEMP